MFTTTSPIWAAGDDFYDAERERWRVVTVLEWPRTWSRRGSVDVDGVLIVVPA